MPRSCPRLPWHWFGGAALGEQIDRQLITGDTLRAIDYKSNRDVPAHPRTRRWHPAPDGAYRQALRQLWPGHRVETAILWTATRSLMPLPDPLLDAAIAGLDPAGSGA